MESNDMIIRYLQDYAQMNNPQYAVLLRGKWGCGKTYFIKNLIQEWTEHAQQRRDQTITLKPLYISLNGVATIHQVTHLIKRELRPILYSKGAQIAKNILLGGIKTISKGMIDINRDGHNDDLSALLDIEAIMDILLKPNDNVCGQKILIFDDLERCKIPTDEIFGYINNFVEHAQCKVILIGEEDKLQELYSTNTQGIAYKDFKEKLIGQTFIVNHDIPQVIDSFLSNSTCRYLSQNKSLIVDFFCASQIENLRILNQCFSDFERFLSFIDCTKYAEEIVAEFTKQTLAYFIITYCEYKSGHVAVEFWQEYLAVFLDAEIKDNHRDFETKYEAVMNKHGIKYSSHSITPKQIVLFITTGYLSSIELNDILTNSLDKQHIQESDWEILWRYRSLENEVFETTFEKVTNLFYNESSAIHSVPVVLHISLILLNIGYMGIKRVNKRRVLTVAKRRIAQIYQFDSINEENLNLDIQDLLNRGARGFGYQHQLAPNEAKNLFDYTQKCQKKKQEQIYRSTCKTYWETVDDDSLWDIDDLFLHKIALNRKTYDATAMFKYVSPQVLGDRILKLSNHSKLVFKCFLERRYENGIKAYHVEELNTLQALLRYLRPKLKQFQLIDKSALINILEILKKSIERLQNNNHSQAMSGN